MDVTPATGSIRRTLAILRALAGGPLTLGQVAAATALPKPTALRTLRICEEEGFVRITDGSWRLSTLLWRLGVGAVELLEVSNSVPNVLADLMAATGETAVFAIYEDGQMVYANQVESTNPVRAHVRIGHRVPALRTATGISVLAMRGDDSYDMAIAAVGADLSDHDRAELDQRLEVTSSRGYALNTDGMWPGMWGLAASVLDRNGEAIAAVGLAAPTDRRPDDVSSMVTAVVEAAHRLSAVETSRQAALSKDGDDR